MMALMADQLVVDSDRPGRAVRRPMVIDGASRQTAKILFQWLICLCWLTAVVPSWINISANGREAGSVLGISNIVPTQLGNILTYGLTAAIVSLSILSIALAWRRSPTGAWMLAVPTGLWVWLQLSTFANSGGWYLTPASVVALILCPAFWVLRPRVTWFAIFGRLAICLAVVSLVYAVFSPSAWMLGTLDTMSETKAFLGSGLLAGPLGNMNDLGMSLVMGLPFIWLIRNRVVRVGGIVAVVSALVLSSSRTSMIALGCIALVVVCCAALGPPGRRRVYGAALVTLTLLGIYVPFSTVNPTAFTDRGAIWDGQYCAMAKRAGVWGRQ